ncbi:hypothetical protein [Actinomadura latina]|uniref:Uncharacterized protein n=1 Tax=Actinomadura latina TaxID=163603 RepID=A0A846ZA28_9ACTN|nr:hypothetical protein [Actinomadura latina]NKZ07604.1 hypothetical protein [Actinomadura latina]
MSASPPKALSDRTLAALAGIEELTPVLEKDLVSAMSPDPVGTLRVLRGERIAKVVCIGLTVEQIGMDSHMIFAFTAADSAVPHFTLDSVKAGGYLAYHIDLVPRADLGAHLEYVNAVFQPLTPAFEEVRERFGPSTAAIGPRQHAVMSPWMLVNRADEEHFRQIGAYLDRYFEHWRDLLVKGVPDDVRATLADTDLAARDARNRAALFSPEVDPVWANVARLVGDEQAEELRGELLSNDLPDGAAADG